MMKWFGYLIGEVVLVLAGAWAIDGGHTGWCIVAASAAGVLFFLASRSYRRWILASGPSSYLPQFGITGAGIIVVLVGCIVIQTASDGDRQWLAAVGSAAVFSGLMPVAHFVRTDMNSLFSSGPNLIWKQIVAWEMNAIFIAAALVPGLLALGAALPAAGAIAFAWWLSALVDRLATHAWYRLAALAMVVLLALTVFFTLHTGLEHTTVKQSLLVVGGGVLVALGLIDGISAYVRRSPAAPMNTMRARMRRTASVGVPAVAVGVAGAVWMVVRLGGVRGSIQAIVIVACVALGASFIVRGQGFVVVALLGALLVWTVQDRNTTQPLDPPIAAPEGTIVALGDSYIAGEGSKLFFSGTNVAGGNDCRRSPTAFPYLLADRFDRSLVFLACSGALASQIWHDGQIEPDHDGGLVGSLPQLANPLPAEPPDLVLVSIGGNDALFGAVGKGCVVPGSCTDLAPDFEGNLPRVGDAVGEALRQVSAAFPNSPIVVVPYPQMFATSGCNRVPFDGGEVKFLRDFVDELDATIERAVDTVTDEASDRNITYFAEGESAYAGQELCAATQTRSPINTITLAPTQADTVVHRMLPNNWTHMSFHPNRTGHELMAAALERWIPDHVAGFGDAPAAAAPPPSDAVDGQTVQPAAPTVMPSATCPARKECLAKVDEWTARQALDALRGILLPAFLLLSAGWLFVASGRRHRA